MWYKNGGMPLGIHTLGPVLEVDCCGGGELGKAGLLCPYGRTGTYLLYLLRDLLLTF